MHNVAFSSRPAREAGWGSAGAPRHCGERRGKTGHPCARHCGEAGRGKLWLSDTAERQGEDVSPDTAREAGRGAPHCPARMSSRTTEPPQMATAWVRHRGAQCININITSTWRASCISVHSQMRTFEDGRTFVLQRGRLRARNVFGLRTCCLSCLRQPRHAWVGGFRL